MIYKYYDTQIRFRFFSPFLITVKAIHSFSFIYCIHLFIEIESGVRVVVSRITAKGSKSDISSKDLLEERCLGFLRDATDPPPARRSGKSKVAGMLGDAAAKNDRRKVRMRRAVQAGARWPNGEGWEGCTSVGGTGGHDAGLVFQLRLLVRIALGTYIFCASPGKNSSHLCVK